MDTTGIRPLKALLALILTVAATLSADRCSAQMTPVLDLRQLNSDATAGAVHQSQSSSPAPFSSWFDSTVADAYSPPDDHAVAFAFQASSFFPGGVFAAGHTAGNMQGPGSYHALSRMDIEFSLNHCVEFVMEGKLILGSPVGTFGSFSLHSWSSNVGYVSALSDTNISTSFRLSPGTYGVKGLSSISGSVPDIDGPTYEFTLLALIANIPFIAFQPGDTAVAVGDTAIFEVVPADPRASLSFQWRKNGELLVDEGNISGAATSILLIHPVAYADSGYYDVALNDGTITEYSTVAQLTINEAASVLDIPVGSLKILALEPAVPNPFSASTTFRYTASAPTPVTMAIYDANGRLVRPLSDGILAGRGAVSWDGKTASGAQAPSGVYFFRLDPGRGQEEMRRVTLLR